MLKVIFNAFFHYSKNTDFMELSKVGQTGDTAYNLYENYTGVLLGK